MALKVFKSGRSLILASVWTVLLSVTGCSTGRQAMDESDGPRVRWFAHCDTCNWCKGGFKNSQAAQETVTSHNKQIHDWYKVAYYNQVKCP